MPTLRFLGYLDYMDRAYRETTKTPHEKKVDKLKKTLTEEEYEEYYGD